MSDRLSDPITCLCGALRELESALWVCLVERVMTFEDIDARVITELAYGGDGRREVIRCFDPKQREAVFELGRHRKQVPVELARLLLLAEVLVGLPADELLL